MENFRPVPKPANKKKRKKVNGYKDKAERVCYYCGTDYAERHEIFGGPNRQISIDYGFQVDLCPNCHRAWHEQKKTEWIRRKRNWQAKTQIDYESNLIKSGKSVSEARESWMQLIGKNYI